MFTGDKRYYLQDNVGSAKYTVNFHDGIQRHMDGSRFYNMKLFSNKANRNDFVNKLKKEGYVQI